MTPIPLLRASQPPAADGSVVALVLTDDRAVPQGFALVRHAAAAAVAQAGACTCCRVPSGLTTVLRQLFLDRVRGTASFDLVIVAGDEALIAEALSDPLVAARYAYRTDARFTDGRAPAG